MNIARMSRSLALSHSPAAVSLIKLSHFIHVRPVEAVAIGLAALVLALTVSGIIAMPVSVYTVFTSGMLVPVVAGFYKE